MKDRPEYKGDELTGEQKYIYQFGYWNCEYLELKSCEEVLSIMETEIGEGFPHTLLKENQHKKVLVYVEDVDGYFIYGDGNYYFPRNCFK